MIGPLRLFALAFAVLGANRMLLTYVAEAHEAHTWLSLAACLPTP